MTNAARGRAANLAVGILQTDLTKARTAIRLQTDRLTARLARTTMRERVLLGGLVMIAIAYAPVAAFEWRSRQEDLYVDAVTERDSARLARDSARRITSNVASDVALRDMQDWGFEAANIPVAKVLIERRLLEEATKAGLTNARITMNDQVQQIGSVTWLDGEIQADLWWKSTFDLLDNLGAWPEGFRVTGFRYQVRRMLEGEVYMPGGPPMGSIRIGLSFPVVIPNIDPDDVATPVEDE